MCDPWQSTDSTQHPGHPPQSAVPAAAQAVSNESIIIEADVHYQHLKKKNFKGFIYWPGPQEFVVGCSEVPEQPQSCARPICHSHAMTRTGREPATIRIAA